NDKADKADTDREPAPHAGLPSDAGPVPVHLPGPHEGEAPRNPSDNRRSSVPAAAPVGDFHGDARPAGKPLEQKYVDGQIDDNLHLITPGDVAFNRDTREFVLPNGDKVSIKIAETEPPPDGGKRDVAQIHEREGGYDIHLSPRARNEDVVRAVAHELAEIRLSQDDDIPISRPDLREDRPDAMTPHLAGRFAELKVLAAHIDRAVMDPAAKAEVLPRLRNDLHDLTRQLGFHDPTHKAVVEQLLHDHDSALAQRIGLEEHDILGHRPKFEPSLDEHTFEQGVRDHLDQLEQHLTGPHAPDTLRAEEQGLHGRMREELSRRIFDPIFDPETRTARKTWDDLNDALNPLSAVINDPSLSPSQRADALHQAIEDFRAHPDMTPEVRDAIGDNGFQHMHDAAQALADAPDHITGVLDTSTGRLTIDGRETTLGEFLQGIDQANRGATENGLNVEYTVVLHDPVNGHSAVEVLPRPRPQHRLPLEQNRFGPNHETIPRDLRPSAPAAAEGGHTIDVGVGRGAYAVELTPEADRSHGGLVLKTELASEMPGAAQRRRDLGILDPGPLTEPGTVMVFADLLNNGHLLGDGPGGEVARIYINNVSAHLDPSDYHGMAERLEAALKPGGRVEIQWDPKPENTEGPPKYRGHITGPELWQAIKDRYAGRPNPFRIVEETTFPGNGFRNYDYTIDTGASNNLNRDRMAGIIPPIPEHRMVIAYEPHDAHTQTPVHAPDPGGTITPDERDVRRNALPDQYYLYGGDEARLKSGQTGPPLRWDATADHGNGAWVEREGTLEPTPDTPDHLRDDQKFMQYIYEGDRPSFSAATKYAVYSATEMNADGTYKCAVSGRTIPVVTGSDGHPQFHEVVGGQRTRTTPPDWYTRGENPPSPPHDKFTIPEPNSAHMGHLPDYEYWRQREYALNHDGTVEQFERVYDDPGHYRLELKEENEGHGHESIDPGYGKYPQLYRTLFPGETIKPIPAAPPDDSGIIKGRRKLGDPRR
ncbi:GH-E family nuclease, partial [Nocardia sp. NPDC004722]